MSYLGYVRRILLIVIGFLIEYFIECLIFVEINIVVRDRQDIFTTNVKNN